MTLFVADIASYQAGLVPAALKPDCAALIVKCTQGSGYVDPNYAAWLDEARHSGLLVGAYHYVDGSSPAAQAANLRAHIIDPTLVVMLDEEQVGLPQTLEVADAMTALGLHVRLVYLSRTYWSAIGSPDLSKPFASRGLHLVNAAYPSSAAKPAAALYPGDTASAWAAYGGVVPSLWQFTESATEAGQRIDVSAFRGSVAELTDLFATITTPAPPAPKPAAVAAFTEESSVQIEPTSIHPGEYALIVPPGVGQFVVAADGGTLPGAVLRVVLWANDKPTVINNLTVGGGSGHHVVAHPLAGATAVTVRRLDAEAYPVAVGFRA